MNQYDNILVSFCIATYRRQKIVTELIEEILSIQDDRFEVVVTDNRSDDGSLDTYKNIDDNRLRVIENKNNLGSLLNMCEALDNGNGRYLFYINDRDQVDRHKIKKLLCILSELETKDVAFGMCYAGYPQNEDYSIYKKGNDAVIQFACKVSHPTGYFFKRDTWERTERRKFFENQAYGIYGFTMVCALQAREHNGARIYGDVCDISRKRIDFSTNKSRFYENRSDKALWYSAKAQCNELKILFMFMREYGFDEEVIRKCFGERYKEYLRRTTINLKGLLKEDSNTVHYGVARPRNNFDANVRTIKYYFEMRAGVRKLLKRQCDEKWRSDVRRINKENSAEMRDYLINELLTSIIRKNYKW